MGEQMFVTMTDAPGNRLRRLLSLAAALVLLAAGSIALPQIARAAQIDDAITSLKITTWDGQQVDDPLAPYAQVTLEAEWAVPDDSRPGDTFTLVYPEELNYFGRVQGTLDNADGETVATYVVDDDTRTVTFTLTDFVREHPTNIRGSFDMTMNLSGSIDYESGDPVSIEFEGSVSPDVPPIELPVRPGSGERPQTYKSSWFQSQYSGVGSRIVNVIRMTNGFEGTVTVTDTPEYGSELVCEGFEPEVRASSDINALNELHPDFMRPVAVESFECTPERATYTFTAEPDLYYDVPFLTETTVPVSELDGRVY